MLNQRQLRQIIITFNEDDEKRATVILHVGKKIDRLTCAMACKRSLKFIMEAYSFGNFGISASYEKAVLFL